MSIKNLFLGLIITLTLLLVGLLIWSTLVEAHGHGAMGSGAGVYNSAEDAVNELCPLNDLKCKDKVRAMAKGSDADMNLPRITIPKDTNDLTPAHWDVLDELAFEIYANLSSGYHANTLGIANREDGMRLAYKSAEYFLLHMERHRKPYTVGK